MKDFPAVFTALKSIIAPYESKMTVVHDTPALYYLDTNVIMQKHKKPAFFAAVRVGKSYVSFYLMLVYLYPELGKTMSPELKKRRQGKSCFNFTTVDKALIAELKRLTKVGMAIWKKEGLSRYEKTIV